MKKLITLILGIAFIYSCSTNSNENTITTAVPEPPTNLLGVGALTTQISLSWTDNSTNETGFKIERKTGSGTYVVVGTVTTDVTTFNDNSLNASTTYTYRVYSYNSGGNSPTYSNEVNVTTLNVSALLPNVTIGTQIWSSTNLDVTTYRDGTFIPEVTDPDVWANLTTGAWCYYQNNLGWGNQYGKLYNWYAIAGIFDNASLNNPSLRKQFAPNGWHVPSDAEWSILINYLDSNSNGGSAMPNLAGGKMKSVGTTLWQTPNTGATNSSGFSGFPGGKRIYNGVFETRSQVGMWWSSSEFSITMAWYRSLNYSTNSAIKNMSGYGKTEGLSVRCIRD